MIETRPDWCVSRQEYGVYLFLSLYKKSNEILIDDEIFENIANIYENKVQIVGFLMTLKNF